MGILSSLFGWISKLFKQLVSLFKKILPYLMVALAIYLLITTGGLPLADWFGPAFAGITIPEGPVGALLALGTSFLFAPDETAELVGNAVEAVGTVVEGVLNEAVDIIDSVASNALSSPFALIALGIGLFFLVGFLKKDNDQQDPKNQEQTT